MIHRLRMVTLTAALAVLTLAQPARAASLEVVTSFSILADLVEQIGGERVTVTPLVDRDEDAHAYQPRPSDARRMRDADLLVANGLGFDDWMRRLAESSGHEGPLIIASNGVGAIEDEGSAHIGHDHGPTDPHAWQDAGNVKIYVRNIARALIEQDPESEPLYLSNLSAYTAQLQELDREIRERIATLPEGRRKAVVSHDAFGYFSHAYGIEFLAAAGISNYSEISAAGMARLIRQIRRAEVPVVFLENVTDPRLIERIGEEAGARFGGVLYSDALSSRDEPSDTYINMMRTNLDTLMAGLAPEQGE